MNTYTSPHNLPFFSELKRSRESQIDLLINNLKIKDVKKDTDFERTSKSIKSDVLLTPVEIGDPKFEDHEYVESGGRKQYIHRISVPFTGDSELFSHTPEKGFSFSSSEHGLILPYGDEIKVEVELAEINPKKAIEEARSLLSMDMQFVNSNNASVEAWSKSIEQRIDQQLKAKREELIQLFG